MNCPRCEVPLTEVVRHGVTLDTCPGCGGLWLDKGELAKIIGTLKEAEASVDAEFAAARPERTEYRRDERERRSEEDRYHESQRYDRDHRYDYKHKKKSALEKLFEVFD